MIFKNKRGVDMWWIFLIVAVFIAVVSYSVSYAQGKRQIGNYIGEYQFSMMSAVNDAEKAFLYIDQSAKYSLQQASYDIAKSGGISEERDIALGEPFVPYECGRYYGSYAWLEIKKDKGIYLEKDCFDESLARHNLEYVFDKKLNGFLANYPERIPTSNYDYEFQGNLEVLGIAKEPMKIEIKGKKVSSTTKAEYEKIGEYSIKPSFKAKIDYNIDEEYSSLKTQLMVITKECKSKDMEKCLKEKSRGLEWECGESDKDILYVYIYKLNDCLNSNTDDMLCTFSLDKRDYLNNVKSERNFEIKMANSVGRVKADMFEERKLVATDYISMGKLKMQNNNRESEGIDADSITIKIKYSDGNPAVEDAYASTKESAKLDLSRNFYIYKKNGIISFIDKTVEGLFRPEVVNSVEIPLTKGVNFCAKTDKQLYAYDSSDNTVKLRDIIYNFAVAFPKPPPLPIQKLEVFDALKSENSAILVWDNVKDDADSYSIYYSDKDFADIKMEEINNDADIKKINVVLKNKIEIEDIDLKNCAIGEIGNPCKYGIYNNPLQPNKLYYVKSKNKHVYAIANILDGKEHNFAIVAENNAGQLDNDKSIEGNIYVLTLDKNYFRFAPVDDLAPGKVTELDKIKTPEGKTKITWKRPSKNIDGSDVHDISDYKIYYKNSLSNINPQLEPGHQIKQITAADAKCDTVSLFCEHFVENIAGLEKGQPYNFAVIPIDEKGNEYNLESERISMQIE